jgi:hypothetical protein
VSAEHARGRESLARFARSRAGWPTLIALVALGGLLVRLLLIAHSDGGTDLRIYTYFSRLGLHGLNPFNAPAGGLFSPSDSNQPPIEVAVFAGLLAIHDSPTTLRLLFALADVGVIVTAGLWFPRSRRWRTWFMTFYAFNPFVLVSWTVYAEDKTLLFGGILVWIAALERDRQWIAWLTASALTVFKFLGAFSTPAQALHSYRTRGSWVWRPIALYVAVFLLSNLPWFPHSFNALSSRNTRLSINPPIHASPTLILSRLGLYAPIEAKLLTALAILAVLALFARRRIDIREAVIWSLVAGYIFLPDDPGGRLLLVTLPFLLILRLSTARWIAIWVVSSIAGLATVVATHGVPHALSSLGGPLRTLFAHEATVRHVLWMNVLLVLVIAFYFTDRAALPTGWSAKTVARRRARRAADRAPGPRRAGSGG